MDTNRPSLAPEGTDKPHSGQPETQSGSVLRVNRFGTVCYVPVQERITFAQWAEQVKQTPTDCDSQGIIHSSPGYSPSYADNNDDRDSAYYSQSAKVPKSLDDSLAPVSQGTGTHCPEKRAFARISEDRETQRQSTETASAMDSLLGSDLESESTEAENEHPAKRQKLLTEEQNLKVLDRELEALASEIRKLEKELDIEKRMTMEAEYIREMFEQVLGEEELLEEACLNGYDLAKLREKQAVEWDIEERDRQFDFARDMQAFYWSEYLWENSFCLWGGPVMVMLLMVDCCEF